jgi:hypothetical protein
VAKSVRELLVPILFLVEGVFWLGIVATGGAQLLVLAALAFILSGVLLFAMPSGWVTRPLAGASALFGLTLTLYQVYEASTLFGTGLSTLGLESGAIFGLFAILSIYLELATLAMRSQTAAKAV